MSEHVSLLKDLKAGKNCSTEAAVAIEYLEAALESANQRAEEAEKQLEASSIYHEGTEAMIEELKASLADREGELDQALELGRVIELEKTHQDTELESLRERLRWRKWPDEKPETAGPYMTILTDIEGEPKLEHEWQAFNGTRWECDDFCRTVYWLPAPAIPTESPDTGEKQ